MFLKTILFLIFICSSAFADFTPGEYWVITEQDGTVIRVVSKQELPTPNENELKLFKAITVDFQTEQEYYDFVNTSMEQEVLWADPEKTKIQEVLTQRTHKLDVQGIEGKGEKISVKSLEENIVSVDSIDVVTDK